TCGRTPLVFPHVLKLRVCSDNPPDPVLTTQTRQAKQPVVFRASYLQPQAIFPATVPPLQTPSGEFLRLAEPPQSFPLAPQDHSTRLCDSLCETSVQVPRCSLYLSSVRERCGSLWKDAIETVPLAEMKKGFYSPYFIVPKKGGGLRPILDLRILNRALLKLPFKMLTLKHILTCVRAQDWFVAIDLKDAYFHVSILPRHRPFLQFAFEGRAYQYKVLPFSLSLSARVFTKVAEAALAPLREVGICILTYLDDWLILAHSHRDVVLNHVARLGLQVYWEKSKLSPAQSIFFLSVELDSVS
ncbi:hypothetical protein M9458_055868, partial [Cirrhinus mrigala]